MGHNLVQKNEVWMSYLQHPLWKIGYWPLMMMVTMMMMTRMVRYNYMLMWVDVPNLPMKTYQLGMTFGLLKWP